MSTGQSFLTLGALILVTIIIMNYNRTLNNIDTSLDFSRFRLEALSVLTSHAEQLSQYFFDEASTDTTSSKLLNDFSSAYNLGYDADDYGIIDDIDDLNGVTVVDTGMSGIAYNVGFEVDYVQIVNNRIVPSLTRQYHKRVTINVTDPYNPPLIYSMQGATRVRDTLSVSFVVSYWFYN